MYKASIAPYPSPMIALRSLKVRRIVGLQENSIREGESDLRDLTTGVIRAETGCKDSDAPEENLPER